MHKLLRISILFAVAFTLIFSSCKDDNKENGENITNNDNNQKKQVINEESINEIISSFPSPIEMAAVIKSINQPFNKKYLIDPDKTLNYDLNTKKAFALGILSADLGYLNVYEKTNLIVEYLSAIKKLSDELRVSQFFDFQTLKRLATSNENIDSLQFLSVQSFRDMDEYLRSSGKSNLSLLAVTGVYIESLYLLVQVAESTPTQELKERLGEQKFLLDLLYPVLKIYSIDDKYFADLYSQLTEIYSIYQKIEIKYEKGESKTEIIDGRVVVTQNEKSTVIITDEQFQQIIFSTKKIRNNLINL